jgi:hypothetical protein
MNSDRYVISFSWGLGNLDNQPSHLTFPNYAANVGISTCLMALTDSVFKVRDPIIISNFKFQNSFAKGFIHSCILVPPAHYAFIAIRNFIKN